MGVNDLMMKFWQLLFCHSCAHQRSLSWCEVWENLMEKVSCACRVTLMGAKGIPTMVRMPIAYSLLNYSQK